MKYSIFLILFTFICINNILAQENYNYYKFRSNYNKALIASSRKDYTQAVYNYKEAFKYGNKYLPNSIQLEDYAICLLNNKDTASAYEALKKSVVRGNSDIVNSERISSIFSKKYIDKIKQEMPTLNKQYWNNIENKENYIAIVNLEAIDQAVRNNFENTFSKNIFMRILEITDSLNHLELKKLVIEKDANPLCFLLEHLYGYNQKYVSFYDSVIRSNIFRGRCSPEFYIQWYDRQRTYVEKKQTQLFGVIDYTLFSFFDNEEQYHPIEDVINLDKRRAELGLVSLEEEAKINGWVLPPEYKKLKKEPKK
jgi:hypothetical protein